MSQIYIKRTMAKNLTSFYSLDKKVYQNNCETLDEIFASGREFWKFLRTKSW